MEISKITEKDSIGLGICCGGAAGDAVTDADRGVKGAAEGISKNAVAGAGGDVESAAENADGEIF